LRDNFLNQLTLGQGRTLSAIWNTGCGICAAAYKVNLVDDFYVFRLRAFRATSYAEFDLLAFIEGFVAACIDDASEVNENIRAGLLLDKAKTFLSVEPFDGAGSNSRHSKSLNIGWKAYKKAGAAGKIGTYLMKNRTRNYGRDIEMVNKGKSSFKAEASMAFLFGAVKLYIYRLGAAIAPFRIKRPYGLPSSASYS
jgi:hypothetical protein